ncbi:hypothetical protein BJY52DRAFT_413160 [Lactarius psammicola]|nr:hypothetical protein BJY52DRAFT_413160 [Lactarius psammicola]
MPGLSRARQKRRWESYHVFHAFSRPHHARRSPPLLSVPLIVIDLPRPPSPLLSHHFPAPIPTLSVTPSSLPCPLAAAPTPSAPSPSSYPSRPLAAAPSPSLLLDARSMEALASVPFSLPVSPLPARVWPNSPSYCPPSGRSAHTHFSCHCLLDPLTLCSLIPLAPPSARLRRRLPDLGREGAGTGGEGFSHVTERRGQERKVGWRLRPRPQRLQGGMQDDSEETVWPLPCVLSPSRLLSAICALSFLSPSLHSLSALLAFVLTFSPHSVPPVSSPRPARGDLSFLVPVTPSHSPFLTVVYEGQPSAPSPLPFSHCCRLSSAIRDSRYHSGLKILLRAPPLLMTSLFFF